MVLHVLIRLGAEPGLAVLCLLLLLTYSADAVAWTGAAALLVRRKSLSSSTQHLFWKMALFGPLVATLLTLVIPWGIERALGKAPYFHEVAFLSLADAPRSTAPDAEPRNRESTRESAGSEASAWRVRADPGSNPLPACAVGAAALGLLRFTASALLLWRSLRGRRRVHDARLLQRLEGICARTGLRRVELTESANVGSPLVIGTSEICIPRGSLAALADAEVDTVFAHELAHLERRDGLWFLVAGLVQSVLWMQPFNHWVSSRFRESAELACDDRAVELTGDPLGLARALLHVAAGASFNDRRAMIPTMARSASSLLPRVQRLVDAGSRKKLRTSAQGRPWGIASLAVVGVVTTGLSVQVARVRPSQPAGDAVATMPSSEGAFDSTVDSPPDAAALSVQVAELVRREHQLEAQIEITLNLPGAGQPGTQASVRLLELRQDLRHVRATETWTEERFIDASTTWEKRRAVPSRPSR